MRVAGPFGCRCPSIPPCPVSTPRSSNRACGFAAPGSPTGFSSWPTVPSCDRAFTGVDSCFCDRRTVNGVARPCGQSPGPWSRPQRTRSEAPSLRRHYPASTVLWASPTPQAARPVPRGRPVGSRSHRLGSPVLRAFSLCRHAIATTPAGSSQGSGCSPDFDDGGLPQMTAGSAPASTPFRGLLGVHACYGLPARGTAKRSFPSKAPAVSLPLLPLRLLLAGATVARREAPWWHPFRYELDRSGAFPFVRFLHRGSSVGGAW